MPLRANLLIAIAIGLSACGTGSPDQETKNTFTPPPPPATGETRDGVSYDVLTVLSTVPNAADNESGHGGPGGFGRIAFTIHEPNTLVGGETYPLILHSHGYSGSKTNAASRPTDPNSFMGQFLANGYGVLSLDERGNGQSGGEVRILDPAAEGVDWMTVLDWVENNIEWLAYEPADPANNKPDTGLGKGNPLMGAIGGSYGGGFQHLVYAIDDLHRIDALAPEITWNDLRYSLYANGVFKSLWGNLLAGLGSAPPNTQSRIIQEGLAQGNSTNSLSDEQLDLLYRNSLASHCAEENDFTAIDKDGMQKLVKIDSLIWQSHLDTLFDFNDAYRNYACLKALGGDVRLLTKNGGHGLYNGSGNSAHCGVIEKDASLLAWYNEKLKGETDAAKYIPDICYAVGENGDDGIVVTEVAVESNNNLAEVSPEISVTNYIVGESQATSATVPAEALYKATANGEVLAGIPRISIELSSPLALPIDASVPTDPIVFVGLGIRGADGSDPTQPLNNQITAIRGFDTFDVDLVGVFTRLQQDEEVVVMLFPSHNANTTAFLAGEAPGTRDVGQYPTNGTAGAGHVDIKLTVKLPMIGVNNDAPTGPNTN